MSDIISREQFREQMYHRCFEVDNDENMQKWDSGNWLRWKLFEEELGKAPSAEPKKGKWIEPTPEGCFTHDAKAYSMCSECGKKEFLGWRKNFCPNCGSDMRGEQRPSAVVSTKNWDDMIVEAMIRNAVRSIKAPSAEPKEHLIKKILSSVEDGEL